MNPIKMVYLFSAPSDVFAEDTIPYREHREPYYGETIEISFKRTKDIPNQCFPLTSKVSGCLPSVVVLGTSQKEGELVSHVLNNHPEFTPGVYPIPSFHDNPYSNNFGTYFSSFPMEVGGWFKYFEIAPAYLYSDKAPLSIRKTAPTSVFLVPLMNPIDHVISEFYSQTNGLPSTCLSVPIEDFIQQEIDILNSCGIPLDFPRVSSVI